MASPPLLALREARVTFGGRPTFTNVSAALGPGDRACLVGRNGSGKSTILRVLAGLTEIDSGERFQQPGTRIAYMPQEPVFPVDMSVADFVTSGLPPDPEHSDRSYLVDAVLEEVGVAAELRLSNLSGGEGRRVSLAHALVSEPDILLLDEPTNHLDIGAIEWLEERIAGLSAGVLIVSHDRAFLKRLSRRTLWLDRGFIRELDKGYDAFEEWSEGILTAEAAEMARADKRILSETQWSREGISARRKRNQGRVRRLEQMRMERSQRVTTRQAKLGEAEATESSRMVIELKRVSKSFEGDAGPKLIAQNFSTRVQRGDRVGLIGRNGAGKSTLLGIMAGSIEPDSGSVRQAKNLEIAVFDQRRATLNPSATLWATLTGDSGDTINVRGTPRHVGSYLKDFLFEERQYRAQISSLSGGERNRLLLAKVLAQPSNVLILDEPTNDLDMDTLDLLEDLLADYEGTLLLVSHDRDFLDRLVTSVIAVEGNGVVDEYVGGYTDYLRQRTPPPLPKPVAKKPAPRAPERPKERPAERMGYKEKRELETLPEQIAKLETEKTEIETRLADPQRYTNDRPGLETASRRHKDIVAALADAEERWLALAERAETLARDAK